MGAPLLVARRHRAAGISILSLLVALACDAEPQARPLLAAAASLQRVVPDLERAFQAGGGRAFDVTYAGSGALAAQLAAGAPADAVLFASAEHVDRLIRQGHAARDTRAVVAGNRIVLVGRANGLRFESLAAIEAGERIAIGDPDFVPAGSYAREALKKLTLWEDLQGRLIYTRDVTAALALARRGEVRGAIVYATDVRDIDDVTILDVALGDWAPEPQVVAAVVAGSRFEATARDLVEFLTSASAAQVLVQHGFQLP